MTFWYLESYRDISSGFRYVIWPTNISPVSDIYNTNKRNLNFSIVIAQGQLSPYPVEGVLLKWKGVASSIFRLEEISTSYMHSLAKTRCTFIGEIGDSNRSV